MNTRTKKTVIATAGLAAAGLFGSLPFDGSSGARGVPTVHRDIALVDITSDLLSSETSLDDSLYASAIGGEATLYHDAVTALGAVDANLLLGATNATDLFDGAYDSFSSGVFLDTWAAEDELNHLLGGSAGASEAGILLDIAKDPVVIPVGDALPLAGSTGFDTTLMTIAGDDFALGTTEFTSYLAGTGDLDGVLSGLLGDLGLGDGVGGLGTGLTGLLGDLGLGSVTDGVGGLGTDLTGLLDGVLGLL